MRTPRAAQARRQEEEDKIREEILSLSQSAVSVKVDEDNHEAKSPINTGVLCMSLLIVALWLLCWFPIIRAGNCGQRHCWWASEIVVLGPR